MKGSSAGNEQRFHSREAHPMKNILMSRQKRKTAAQAAVFLHDLQRAHMRYLTGVTPMKVRPVVEIGENPSSLSG